MKRSSAWWMYPLVVMVVLLCATGCSSAGTQDDSPASGGTTSEAVVAEARHNVEMYYANTKVPPTSDGPQAVRGKRVTLVDIGMSAPTGAEFAKATELAAQRLGWTLTTIDAKYQLSTAADGVRQAIASGAEGILLFGVDCPPIKAALEQARMANIPVVNAAGQDCNEAEGGGPSLFTRNVLYPPLKEGGEPVTPFKLWRQFGIAQADWMIANTDGKARVLVFDVPDFAVTAELGRGFRERLAQCGGCKIEGAVTVGVKDFGPNLQGIAEQALLKYPKSNAVNGNYSDLMTLGVAAAIRSANRADSIKAVAGSGNADELTLIRDRRGVDAGFVEQLTWDAFAAADQLNRFFADAPSVVSGEAVTMYDREHNMPPSGAFVPLADFGGAFNKIWAGK
ncbi:substrate-binding domain-containing protein [Mycobacterium sp. CBMA293]|uniref:sugar ABC transporter substrate-binding protein n=1 Tax=unclassified Mycolicibacterium TaxID=2636767 RepID=UPI0012DC28F9|nr:MULTISPECIES: substrate-binding domain-containing protein [unclassified Mycolicibacterium]MUL50084.1 substrate-binding domain-containing protein [Mycolicibacterium sp. CBMA 360]MUL62545.1 substrate-binding domain-containing protein [Mycolicibacterium sp. CBMA 335]MUL68997.1 substrate-binding domain-containing protein [Mycolicibacterium sp. CBMA 311]MUL96936.1 substrate-binding domain-containing protein [Mycolicibacterium sp. CBMA 230]MUM04026.1 hypothetical protein [Mycolicibacterium sp. CB